MIGIGITKKLAEIDKRKKNYCKIRYLILNQTKYQPNTLDIQSIEGNASMMESACPILKAES